MSFHRGFWATAGISSDNWVMKVDDDGGDDGDDGLVSGQGSSAVKVHQARSRLTKPGQGVNVNISLWNFNTLYRNVNVSTGISSFFALPRS